ncbi:MAG TPA: hypothetical protein VIY69_11725 [Candidatus Acidoferrales bacterium]
MGGNLCGESGFGIIGFAHKDADLAGVVPVGEGIHGVAKFRDVFSVVFAVFIIHTYALVGVSKGRLDDSVLAVQKVKQSFLNNGIPHGHPVSAQRLVGLLAI